MEKAFKVFVGSLPENTTVDELKKLFEPYGPISECDVIKRCGFIHLTTAANGYKAMKDLNGSIFNGTKIVVEKGHLRTKRGKKIPAKGPGPIRNRDFRPRPGGPGERPGGNLNGNRGRDQRPGPLMGPSRGFGGMQRQPDRFDSFGNSGMRDVMSDRGDLFGGNRGGHMRDNRAMGMFGDGRGPYREDRFNDFADSRGRMSNQFNDSRPLSDNMRMSGMYNDRSHDNYDDRRMDLICDSRGSDSYYQDRGFGPSRDNRDMEPYSDTRGRDPMPINRSGNFGNMRDSYGDNMRSSRNESYESMDRGLPDDRRPLGYDRRLNDRQPLTDEPRPLLEDRRAPIDPLPLMGTRRPVMDDRRGPLMTERRGHIDDRRDQRLDDCRPPIDDRRGLVDDRRPLINDRAPMDDRRMPPSMNDFGNVDDRRGPISLFDRRGGPDRFPSINDMRGRGSRNDFGGGNRENGFGSRFSGGPAGGRDRMPPRRF